MSKLEFPEPVAKDEERFNEFMDNFFQSMTNVQDPGDADEDLADITTKLNSLLASLREAGIFR